MDNVSRIANEILGVQTVTLQELLEHPVSKKAISLGELIHNTSKKSIKYKKGCVARLEKAMPKLGRWNFTVKCSEPWSEGPYTTRIRLLKKGKKTKGFLGREVEVSCNCLAWQFNGADWNALNKGYSERQYSNGEAPNVRDPRRKFLICKHVAAVVPLVQKYIIPKGFK